jgi:serine/threonine protein phosphatase PrpC
MSPLNIHPEADASAKKRKNNKALKIFLGIGALIAVPAIGTTLAASITIGSGSIEFGQGQQQAVACDTDGVTVTPVAGFTNANGAGTFKLASIGVSDIAAACDGKTFTLRVYNNTANDGARTVASPAPTPNGAEATALKVLFDKDSTFSTEVGDSDITVSGDATSFTVTLATTLASGSVNKITLETN